MGTPRHNEVIYKRRRMAALLVLLVVIALIIWAVVALRGGSSEPEEEQPTNAVVTSSMESSTTSSSSSKESTTEATTEEETSSAEPTATSTVAADAKKTCELSDLVISASTNQPTFSGSAQPELFMAVHNPTAVDCEIDLEENKLRFEYTTSRPTHESGLMSTATLQLKTARACSLPARIATSRQHGLVPLQRQTSATTALMSPPVATTYTPWLVIIPHQR